MSCRKTVIFSELRTTCFLVTVEPLGELVSAHRQATDPVDLPEQKLHEPGVHSAHLVDGELRGDESLLHHQHSSEHRGLGGRLLDALHVNEPQRPKDHGVLSAADRGRG